MGGEKRRREHDAEVWHSDAGAESRKENIPGGRGMKRRGRRGEKDFGTGRVRPRAASKRERKETAALSLSLLSSSFRIKEESAKVSSSFVSPRVARGDVGFPGGGVVFRVEVRSVSEGIGTLCYKLRVGEEGRISRVRDGARSGRKGESGLTSSRTVAGRAERWFGRAPPEGRFGFDDSNFHAVSETRRVVGRT